MILLNQKITRLLASNLPSEASQWQKGTTYKRNDMVIYQNHIYRNIVNSNTNVQPDLNTGKWLSFGVDNAHACIDLRSHTATHLVKGVNSIELSIPATSIDTLAFGNVKGKILSITELDSSNKVIKVTNKQVGSERACSNNWYNYYFCKIPDRGGNMGVGKAMDVLHNNIDVNTARIDIVIGKNTDGIASIGSLIGGTAHQLGDTQFGVEIDLIDYSEKVTDKMGVTEIIERDVQEVTQVTIEIPAKYTQIVKREVKESLGHVVMIIAEPEKDSNYENLITLGYIDRFSIRILNGVTSIGEMTIKESI